MNHFTKRLLEEGKIEPKYHEISDKQDCEGEATNRTINLAK